MRKRIKAAIAVALLGVATPALAQEVVVTAARRGAYLNAEVNQSSSRPIINLRRTADFAVQPAQIIGDTREELKRHEEIYAMLRGAIELADKHGVELAIGDYIVEPLTLANYKNLALGGGGRSDTNVARFLIKAKLVAGMDAKTALERITKFTKAVPAVGRAEIESLGALTLSVVNPDQYRAQITDLIVADAAATAAKFGPDYGVQATGLDRPVEWARASLTEVFLYLPAAYTVVPKPR
ncbi:MAG: TonB-dependent receptor [Sphingomonas sp.]|uniref:TonB-dependent receptor n=1 Tax=Sphingomonas sp. TaxID=28214 RepID=UPI0022769E2F|nr:TonB-dependent receptor [Sphingomonas sp.]MCX8476141.1 TonB-dependent receptor [Sphingomonas sp.]